MKIERGDLVIADAP